MASCKFKLVIFLLFYFSGRLVCFAQEKKSINPDTLHYQLQNAQNATKKAIILTQLAEFYSTSNPDSAINLHRAALKLAATLKTDTTLLRNNYHALGVIYLRKGEFSNALVNFQEALKATDNDKGAGGTLHNIGQIYSAQGNMDKSFEYYIRGLKAKENAGDSLGMAYTYNDLGTLLMRQKKFNQSLEYYQKSLYLKKRFGSKKDISSTLANIGNVYAVQKIYDTALKYHFESLVLKDTSDKKSVSISYNNIGSIYQGMDSLDKAEEYLLKSFNIRKKLNNEVALITSFFALGELYKTRKDLPQAYYYLLKAEELAKRHRVLEYLKDAYLALSDLCVEKKDFVKGYEYQRLHMLYKDSIYNEESAKQITEMQTKYDTEKKDKELIEKDAEITKQQLETKQKATQRNAFIGGFVLMLSLGLMMLRGYNQKKKAHFEIMQQKEIIEEKNKDITDSINYAKRIQKAMLPSDNYFKKHLSEYFIFYRPKDIVSGDFYWAFETENKEVLIATADCTGHGVPGAFMSMIGNSKLNEIVIERKVSSPDEILNLLREEVIKALNPEDAEEESKDGMDISLCSFDFGDMKLKYAGANNSIYLIRKNELTINKADKFPVGKYSGEMRPFTNQEIALQKGDCIYSFTDGFADQFGGPKGKKFKYKQLQELLISIQDNTMDEQKTILDKTFESWKGNLEQVDDILVIGVRV